MNTGIRLYNKLYINNIISTLYMQLAKLRIQLLRVKHCAGSTPFHKL